MSKNTRAPTVGRAAFNALYAEFSQLADENGKLIEFVRDMGMKAQALVAAVDEDWQYAVAEFQKAKAELNACDIDSEEGTRISHQYQLAWEFLIDTPSPSITALHFKLVTILCPKEGSYTPNINARVLADAARLAGEA